MGAKTVHEVEIRGSRITAKVARPCARGRLPYCMVGAETTLVRRASPDRKLPCARCETPDITAVRAVRESVLDNMDLLGGDCPRAAQTETAGPGQAWHPSGPPNIKP